MVNTTISKSVTIQAETDYSVIWSGGGGAPVWTFAAGSSSTQAIRGFTFQSFAGGAKIFACSSTANASYTFTKCNFKTIVLTDSAQCGIWQSGASSGGVTVTFVNSLFQDIYCAGSSATTRALLSLGNENGNWVLTNCTVYFGTANYSINRIFTSSTTTTSVTVKNCIIRNATGNTINWGSGITTNTATYSCFNSLTSAPTGTGIITSDPLIVDAAGSNFRLSQSSPCIGMGTNL